MEFSPQTITIKSGETVTWINMDGLPHDVVFTKVPEGVDTDDIDHSEDTDQDDSFSSTFTTLCSRRSPKVWTQMILITRKILIRMTPLVQPSRLQVNTIITQIRASMCLERW